MPRRDVEDVRAHTGSAKPRERPRDSVRAAALAWRGARGISPSALSTWQLVMLKATAAAHTALLAHLLRDPHRLARIEAGTVSTATTATMMDAERAGKRHQAA